MTTDVFTKVRSWAAPFMVSIICGMALILWQNQQNIIDSLQDRIASMEVEVGNSRATLAVISENQSNSREDCQEFQQGVTARLDRMEEVLTEVGKSLSALAAIQERQERDSGR